MNGFIKALLVVAAVIVQAKSATAQAPVVNAPHRSGARTATAKRFRISELPPEVIKQLSHATELPTSKQATRSFHGQPPARRVPGASEPGIGRRADDPWDLARR